MKVLRLFCSAQMLRGTVLVILLFSLPILLSVDAAQASSERERDHLKRAKVFLAAGDYRRALDACQKEVEEAPSAESYVYLTYMYHALDGYLDHLAKTERWVAVEHVYLNLISRGAEDLADPPGVLARMAKEIVHGSAQKYSDISAAMATKLDERTVLRLWKQQTAWRADNPDGWWAGIPSGWDW